MKDEEAGDRLYGLLLMVETLDFVVLSSPNLGAVVTIIAKISRFDCCFLVIYYFVLMNGIYTMFHR